MAEQLRFERSARQSSLDLLLERFEAFCRAQRIPAPARREAHLVLDEIVSNIVRHGSRKGRPCRVSVTVAFEQGVLTIQIVDTGAPFDPTRAPVPARDRRLPADGPGGLGLHLVRALMDVVEYRRHRGRNHLLIIRRPERRRQQRPRQTTV
jgi:anti-sigma regulatory factor (Ser/Thr protein kinase)